MLLRLRCAHDNGLSPCTDLPARLSAEPTSLKSAVHCDPPQQQIQKPGTAGSGIEASPRCSISRHYRDGASQGTPISSIATISPHVVWKTPTEGPATRRTTPTQRRAFRMLRLPSSAYPCTSEGRRRTSPSLKGDLTHTPVASPRN